jgi:TRAP-type C4-dicarboxylate transport system permease large subunit
MPLHDVIRGVNPFLVIYLAILTLFIVFPQIVTVPVALMR